MKKVLVVILCLMVLLVGCGKKKEESKPYMVTLDINPTIELEVDGDIAKRINPEGDDAWELINREEFEGKKLDEVFAELVKNAIEKGLVDDGVLNVIVGYDLGEGNSSNDRKMADDYLKEACEKNDIQFNIVIPEITEEARHEAQGYGVTPAKAQVILDAMKGNEELHFDELKDKSAKELREMKETGMYCDREFTLRGDKCERIVKEEKPEEGKACPAGYVEVKGKCYAETQPVGNDELSCPGKEKNGKCYMEESKAAKANMKCSKGTAITRYEAGLTAKNAGDANDIVCKDTSAVKYPVSPCELKDGTEWTKSGGKCYWHRAPVIDTGCPGKVQVDGFCWDDASNIYVCASNHETTYKDKNTPCPDSIKYTKPTGNYSCDSGYTLKGSSCVREVEVDYVHKMVMSCPNGYRMVDATCIDEKDIAEKEAGLICNKDARLEGERCVYYEVVDAKSV